MVVAGLNAVYTEVITVGEVEIQVDGLYFVVVTTLVTGLDEVCVIVEYTAEQVEDVQGTVLAPYCAGRYCTGA